MQNRKINYPYLFIAQLILIVINIYSCSEYKQIHYTSSIHRSQSPSDMSPLAGHTVTALYPTAPIYCGCQIRYPYGRSRGLTRSRGSLLHRGAGDIKYLCRHAPSPRRSAREPSALSLSLRLLIRHVSQITVRADSMCYE